MILFPAKIHRPDVDRDLFVIFIRMVGVQYQYLLEDGTYVVCEQGRPTIYPIRSFISTDRLDAIIPYLPSDVVLAEKLTHGVASAGTSRGDLPRDLVVPIMADVTRLRAEIMEYRRQYSAKMDQIFELFADENIFKTMALDELSLRLFEEAFVGLPPGATIAIFHLLAREPSKCQVCKRGLDEFVLLFPPKKNVRNFEKVKKWARQYQESAAQAAIGKAVPTSSQENPLDSFIEKARRLILKSRRLRSPTTVGLLGPNASGELSPSVSGQSTGETFSESDESILAFIIDTFRRRPRPYNNAHAESVASLILRAVGAYPNLELNNKVAFLLLQEMGVLAPWSERQDTDVLRSIPNQFYPNAQDKLYIDSSKMDKDEDTILPDTMAHLRHDWGQMPVLCIDARGTLLTEDGFSVQPATEDGDSYWLHVHISHPSAYVDPNHLYGKRAAHLGLTIWTPKTTYNMLPTRFSDAKCLRQGRNCNVLTISTLLNTKGEVKDVNIRASIVRNIIQLTPPAVQQKTGHNAQPKAYMTIGNAQSVLTEAKATKFATPTRAELEEVEGQISRLEVCKRLLKARIKWRRERMPENLPPWFYRMGSSTVVSFTQSQELGGTIESSHYPSDPVIMIQGDRYDKMTSDTAFESRELTSHMMVLAGESAAKWCVERKIPMFFQSATAHPEFPVSKYKDLDISDERIDPRPEATTTPGFHVNLELDQYLRCSSPLRRYTDLVNTWQIDSYLRWEAARDGRTGASGGGIGASLMVGEGTSSEPSSSLTSETRDKTIADAEPQSPVEAVKESSVEGAQEGVANVAEGFPSEPQSKDCVAGKTEGPDFPFSRAILDQYLKVKDASITASSQMMRGSRYHWVYQAFFRAFHFDEAVLPEVWDINLEHKPVQPRNAEDSGLRGRLIPFDVNVQVLRSAEGYERTAKKTQYLPVKIELVDPEIPMLYVRAVGPPSDTRTQDYEVNIASAASEAAQSEAQPTAEPEQKSKRTARSWG